MLIKSIYFNELAPELQKQYFEENEEKFSPGDYEWWDCTIEDIKTALEVIGFYSVKIGFSGFWSQGDGAHFTGQYSYQKGALKKVKEDYPTWSELHNLAQALQDAQKKHFYSISMDISHRGHYSHENCTSFAFEDNRHHYGWLADSFDESAFIEPCREFMQDIYRRLEEEYYYLCSWEYVAECPDCFSWLDVTDWLQDQEALFYAA